MKTVARVSQQSRLLGGAFMLCCIAGTTGTALASTQAPMVFDNEAPQVKTILKKAWDAESGKINDSIAESAYALYRKAGTLGSAEGYYRAALIQISNNDNGARQNALCLLSIASSLGHSRAADLLGHQQQKAYCK